MSIAVILLIVALAGLAVGLTNLARPSGRLGIDSRRVALWWVGVSVVLLMVALQLRPDAGETDLPPAADGSTSTTLGPPDAFAPPANGPSGDPTAPMESGADAATVLYVFDGDTVEVDFGGTTERVRLIGINSPEIGECWADEAGLVLGALLPEGSEVGMTGDESDRDQFGRLLRYLWVGSMSVNEELVRRGAALSRRYPPDTALSDRFDAAEADARAGERGVWGC